ncbi:MAG: CoA transferase [Chloroflexi bacterium]|nr:CoA transferase [Chloroflexota bacterium]
MSSGPLPLAGVRVLDFTHVLAGPFATRILGDMGADVVKVNSAARPGNTPLSAYYVMWNRNKRALALDMARDEAKALCRRLCERADIVIDNFSAGVLDRWGIGYESVRAANPGVIYVAMSGMGERGPWSSFVTYAPTVHALAGITALVGVPGREDIGIGFSYNDHLSGLHGAVAVLAALEARRSTGSGQRIELSQLEVGAQFVAPALLDYFANGRVAEASGNDLPYDVAAPHGCYPCAGDDRWVAIAVMDDAQWASLRTVMGDPEWARDERYATAAGRVADRRALDGSVSAWTRDLDAYEVQTRCQAAGVPAGVVQTGLDFASDPQFSATDFLTPIAEPQPAVGQSYADRLPLRFSRSPVTEYRRSRMLGEDNAAVLGDWLDMGADEVAGGEAEGYLR